MAAPAANVAAVDTNLPTPNFEVPSTPTDSTHSYMDDGILYFNSAPVQVDSALKAALREPRERVALLRLETALIDFVQSDAGWLEVGGLYNSVLVGPSRGNVTASSNPAAAGAAASQSLTATTSSTSGGGRQTSFQRCILHRLADRFGIVRENGSVLEGSIRLIKLPDSKVPARLLQDLDASEYAATTTTNNYDIQGATVAMSQTTLLDSNTGNSQAAAVTPQQSSRKMKIMKRSDRSRSSTPIHSNGGAGGGGGSADKKSVLKKSASGLSDKEKAYAEARARIFSDESSSDFGNNTAADGVPLDDVLAFSSSPQRSTTTTTTTTGHSTTESSNSMGKDTTASNSENKAVYRNRLEEAADPDFQRGAVVMYPMSYYSAASAIPIVAASIPYAHSAAAETATMAQIPPTVASAVTMTSATEAAARAATATDVPSTFPKLAAAAPAFYPSWALHASSTTATSPAAATTTTTTTTSRSSSSSSSSRTRSSLRR